MREDGDNSTFVYKKNCHNFRVRLEICMGGSLLEMKTDSGGNNSTGQKLSEKQTPHACTGTVSTNVLHVNSH